MSSPISLLSTVLVMCRGNFLGASVLVFISVCRSLIHDNIASWVRVLICLLLLVLVEGVSFAVLIGGWIRGKGRAGFGASWTSSSWVIVGTFDL